MEPSGLTMFLLAFAAVVALIVGCSAYLYYGRLLFRTRVKGCPVPLRRMVAMTFRGASAFNLVNAYIEAHLAGLEVTLDDLEALDRARGRARKVVRGMIAAKKAGTEISFGRACALDLEGKDIPEEVTNAT